MHAIVYTAIFGEYDKLKQPLPQVASCDFICFTDTNMPSRVGLWRVVRVRRDPKLDSRLQSRWFKHLSHKAFPNGHLALRYAWLPFSPRADVSIWIDASLRIKSQNFATDMHIALGASAWAMFPHPDRDCIYDEARLTATLPKCQGLPIIPQVEAYRSVVPRHAGLYACGVIVRREPAAAVVRGVGELWWEQCLTWTYRDQLSLPYVLRKVGQCEPAHIPEQLRSNHWFDILPHEKEM
jgi:hypothetical protein